MEYTEYIITIKYMKKFYGFNLEEDNKKKLIVIAHDKWITVTELLNVIISNYVDGVNPQNIESKLLEIKESKLKKESPKKRDERIVAENKIKHAKYVELINREGSTHESAMEQAYGKKEAPSDEYVPKPKPGYADLPEVDFNKGGDL